MTDAGLSLRHAVEVVKKQAKPGPFRNLLNEIQEDLTGGESFAEAISKHPQAFSVMYRKMVEAGERSGKLETILNQLLRHMEKRRTLRRTIIRASIYPAVVLLFSICILMGIQYVILPMIVNTKVSSGPISGLVATVNILLKICIGGPIVIFVLSKIAKQSHSGKYAVDLLKLRIPVAGRIIRKAALVRFTRMLGTLIQAGISIVEALKLTRDACGNEVIAKKIEIASESVKTGTSLLEPLRDQHIIDSAVVDMIEVGEETGKLDQTLLKAADYYEEEVETMISYMMSLLEPTLIVLICLFVGYMIIVIWGSISAAMH